MCGHSAIQGVLHAPSLVEELEIGAVEPVTAKPHHRFFDKRGDVGLSSVTDRISSMEFPGAFFYTYPTKDLVLECSVEQAVSKRDHKRRIHNRLSETDTARQRLLGRFNRRPVDPECLHRARDL